MPNHYPELYPPKEKMLRTVFGTFFENWIQSEKLSEIKPSLQEQFRKEMHPKIKIVFSLSGFHAYCYEISLHFQFEGFVQCLPRVAFCKQRLYCM